MILLSVNLPLIAPAFYISFNACSPILAKWSYLKYSKYEFWSTPWLLSDFYLRWMLEVYLLLRHIKSILGCDSWVPLPCPYPLITYECLSSDYLKLLHSVWIDSSHNLSMTVSARLTPFNSLSGFIIIPFASLFSTVRSCERNIDTCLLSYLTAKLTNFYCSDVLLLVV